MSINLSRIELPNGSTIGVGSQVVVLNQLNQFGGNLDAGTKREVDEIVIAEQSDTSTTGQVVISFKKSQAPLTQVTLNDLVPLVENLDVLIGES